MRKKSTRTATDTGLLIVALVVAEWIIAVFSPLPARAAGAKLDRTGSFAIRWWTVEDGLPETPLTAVDLAPDDSVWCATRTSLARFDGQAFDVLAFSITDPIRRQIGDFLGMGFDRSGTLWLVGRNPGNHRRDSAKSDSAAIRGRRYPSNRNGCPPSRRLSLNVELHAYRECTNPSKGF